MSDGVEKGTVEGDGGDGAFTLPGLYVREHEALGGGGGDVLEISGGMGWGTVSFYVLGISGGMGWGTVSFYVLGEISGGMGWGTFRFDVLR